MVGIAEEARRPEWLQTKEVQKRKEKPKMPKGPKRAHWPDWPKRFDCQGRQNGQSI